MDARGRTRGEADRPAVRTTVSVVPQSALAAHGELLRALEEAFPVRFVGSSDADIGASGAVIVFPGGAPPSRLPIPCLTLTGEPAPGGGGRAVVVEMAREAGLDRALHGQSLVDEHHGPSAPVPVGRGFRVLATALGAPVWVTNDAAAGEETASAYPSVLGEREFLRDHLTAGRFWSLLPIVHFLKRLSFGLSAASERHRACFVIDDPNVRFASYGHVRFGALARDARECGYHVALATIPLDLVLTGGRTAGVLREFPSQLSLAVHGNDHVRRELARPSARDAERMTRSAVARVEGFERRVGVRVDRVMCPPHGAFRPAALSALFRAGFLGLAASTPFGWDEFSEHRAWRLGGWLPAQLTAGGLPVIPRHPLARSVDDLVFRALLGLPLIVYCHHGDLRAGLEPLRTAAARIAALGSVHWMPLSSIARDRVRMRTVGGQLELTLFSRDAHIPRPDAPIAHVKIPRIFDVTDPIRVAIDGERHDVTPRPDGGAELHVTIPPGGPTLRVQLLARDGLRAATAWGWCPRPWPVARRAMTETRDRLAPFIQA
jgi:hypothetical protein